MNIQWFKNLIAVSALFFSAGGYAGVITDVKEINTYVGWWADSASWTHDLKDSGAAAGRIQSANLSIEFWDDSTNRWDLLELASIILGEIDFLDGAFTDVPTSNWNGNLGAKSLVSLNDTGMLEVRIQGLFGDFHIGKSTLEVVTSSVPEPGSLVLFALGLLGLGLLRRKNAS